MARQTFDVVIVGGGSAGAVLAARLSAEVHRHVLLLEAGPNFTPDKYPSVLRDANVVAGSPDFDWHYSTEGAARLGHDVPVPRGRVIGGSSAVNAAVAMRARPADFARWAKRGIEGWSWQEVLAAYKAMENTPTGDDAWPGRSGPFPIRQRTAEENTPSMRAFVEASEAVGLSHVLDFNGATQHGVGSMNQSRACRTLPSSATLSKTRMTASWTRRSGSFSSLSPTFTKPTGAATMSSPRRAFS